jgi:hypothetical protein
VLIPSTKEALTNANYKSRAAKRRAAAQWAKAARQAARQRFSLDRPDERRKDTANTAIYTDVIVQLGAAVAGHRQLGVGVPGQLHRLLEGSAALVQQRDVRVPQRVEVGVERAVRPLDRVGDAADVQVDAQHLCGALVPVARPDGAVGGPPGQVAAQGLGHVGREGLHGSAAVLGVLGA